MTIKYILENIFSENEIKWHCKDIDSIAMAEFNVACPVGTPFSEPIIEIKEVFVREECIISSSNTYNSTLQPVSYTHLTLPTIYSV